MRRAQWFLMSFPILVVEVLGLMWLFAEVRVSFVQCFLCNRPGVNASSSKWSLISISRKEWIQLGYYKLLKGCLLSMRNECSEPADWLVEEEEARCERRISKRRRMLNNQASSKPRGESIY